MVVLLFWNENSFFERFLKMGNDLSQDKNKINEYKVKNTDNNRNKNLIHEEQDNDKIQRDFDTPVSNVRVEKQQKVKQESKLAPGSPLKVVCRKTSDMLAPHNSDVVEYCKSLVNMNFHGQEMIKTALEMNFHLSENGVIHSLSVFLQSMDSFLRSVGENSNLTGEEEEFKYFVQGLMEHRNKRNDMDRFWSDANKFVEIYKSRGGFSDQLLHTKYWATRQQLLAGKIIADNIDREYGPLDPVFGVLLCPVAGRAGPGDSGIVHEILFDDDGPLAYHSAAHDAFGYLLTFHNVGPGYNYMGAACEVLHPSRCMSGQISGLYFWKEVLKKKYDNAYPTA